MSLNFNYSFNISEDRSKPINRKKMRYPYRYTHNLSASGNIKLSNKWAVSFNSGYDFEAKKIVQTTFNITRDLHCFSMSASLSPFGQWKYYNFTIRANASILQDLKWEQRSQTQSNIQWYCFIILPLDLFFAMCPQIVIGLTEMFVAEKAVVSGKGRRMC